MAGLGRNGRAKLVSAARPDAGSATVPTEIQSSRLVRNSSPESEVRAIARHLIRDHTDQLRRLTTAAGQLGLQVPSDMSSAQQAIVNRIRSAARGSTSRDRRYLSAQVTAHEQAIILHERVALTVGTPSQLHQLAVLALPILGMHLGEVEMARSDD